MGIPEGSHLESRVEELLNDIEKGPAKYLLNGKSKTTVASIAITLLVVISQGVGNLYYFMAKAPTVEWVDQRINEKIQNAPITRGAEMRLQENQFRINANERNIDTFKADIKEIKNQVTEIKVLLGVQMQKGLRR